jgi:arylformamidase
MQKNALNYSQIIDISVPLHEQTVIYPGTPAMSLEPIKSTATGSQLTKITMSSHVGTHIDAPVHADPAGLSLDHLPMEAFIGPCRVIDCTISVGSISIADLEMHRVKEGERILMKTTNSARGLDMFYEDFVFLSPDAATYLAEKSVALVAIDYFSIKQKGSKDNRPHTELLSKNIPIVEGVDLSHVEPGEYMLVCLPLKFMGIDGSPCRAVLLR